MRIPFSRAASTPCSISSKTMTALALTTSLAPVIFWSNFTSGRQTSNVGTSAKEPFSDRGLSRKSPVISGVIRAPCSIDAGVVRLVADGRHLLLGHLRPPGVTNRASVRDTRGGRDLDRLHTTLHVLPGIAARVPR